MDKNFVCPKCHKESYYYNYSYEFLPNKDSTGHIGNLDSYDKRQLIICPYCYAETPVTEYAEKLGGGTMTVLERIKRVYDHYINKGEIWDWVANEVFDLTTYDGNLDKRFSKKIIEVCKVILNGENFEYIRNEDNYVNYILVCQMLQRHNWINWGTSIRGAWFDDDWGDEEDWKKPLCSLHCIYTDKETKQEIKIEDKIPFTKDNLKVLIQFVEAESGEGMEL